MATKKTNASDKLARELGNILTRAGLFRNREKEETPDYREILDKYKIDVPATTQPLNFNKQAQSILDKYGVTTQPVTSVDERNHANTIALQQQNAEEQRLARQAMENVRAQYAEANMRNYAARMQQAGRDGTLSQATSGHTGGGGNWGTGLRYAVDKDGNVTAGYRKEYVDEQRKTANEAEAAANSYRRAVDMGFADESSKYDRIAKREDDTLHEMGGRTSGDFIKNAPKTLWAGIVKNTRDIINSLNAYGYQMAVNENNQNQASLLALGNKDAAAQLEKEKQTMINEGPYQAKFKQGLIDETAEDISGYGATGRFLAETINGIGGMVPSIISNAIVPGSGMSVMFLGAAGGAMEEAMKNGVDYNTAVVYGVAVGGVEVLTEMIFGGIPGTRSEGWADQVTESLVEKFVQDARGRASINFIINALGEGTEEFLSEYGDFLIVKGLGKHNSNMGKLDERELSEVFDDAKFSFAVGALTGAVLDLPQNFSEMTTGEKSKMLMERVEDAYTKMAEERAIGKEMREFQNDIIDTGKESGQDTDSYRMAMENQARIDAGKKISNRALGQQYIANAAAIDAENAADSAAAPAQNGIVLPTAKEPGNITLPKWSMTQDAQNRQAQIRAENIAVLRPVLSSEVNRSTVDTVIENGKMMDALAKLTGKELSASTASETRSNVRNALVSVQESLPGQYTNATQRGIMNGSNNEGGAVNGRERNLSVSEGSQWSDGQSSSQQAGGVGEEAGRAEGKWSIPGTDSSKAGRIVRTAFTESEGKTKVKSVADAKDKSIGDLSFGEEIDSTKYFGDSGSSETKFREVISGETETTREAKRLAEENGAELFLIAGDDISYANGKKSRGVIRRQDGKKTIVVRVDDSDASCLQLVKHELGHDKIRSGLLNVNDAIERFRNTFSLGKENADDLIDTYLEIKFGDVTSMTDAEKSAAITELVCDALGDIDELDVGIASLRPWTDGFKELKKAVQESISSNSGTTSTKSARNDNGSHSTASEKKKSNAPPKVVNGAAVAPDVAEIMDSADYSAPYDYMDLSVGTKDAWKKSYKEANKGKDANRVVRVVDLFTNKMIQNDAIMNYVPVGSYKYDKFGPLRTNVEYHYTFDMDTSCPRTFQFLNYRNAIQSAAGRYLTYKESINLLELMRAYGQQIPCSYCYVENKRVLLSSSYNNYFAFRQNVMNAATDAEAKKLMYGYNKRKGILPKASQEVYDAWRSDTSYNPDVMEVFTDSQKSRNAILNWLDGQKESGEITDSTTTKKIIDMVNDHFGISQKDAAAESASYVADWMYDVGAGIEHIYNVQNNGETEVNEMALTVHHQALAYAKSASSAKTVENYVPYTDHLKSIDAQTKSFINGMGGIRKHSSNDFRMDYVQDYIMFFADLAAGGWKGHTYTKSTDYVKIFGRTGDRINMSVAFYGDTLETIRENLDEGMGWKDARDLRNAYKENAGVMAMVTNNAQLSYALNSKWVDMIIPFHASGLDKAVWYNLRMWQDYTSKQLERFYNTTDMKRMLKEKGVKVPSGAKAAQVREIFEQNFEIKKILNEDGSVVKPHFFPEDTYVNGQLVPGHHNDAALYKKLCAEYGVKPRFDGVKVTDANGNEINVIDHPNYVKLIKETANTDYEQHEIKFNFDEMDDYLGMTPLDYAMQRMEEEAKNGGFSNTAEDQFGIIDEFKREYLGKDRPLGYLTERAKQYKEIREEEQIKAAKELKAKLEEESTAPEIESVDMSTRAPAEIRNLVQQNRRLQKQVEYWQAQSKATKGWKADAKQEAANAKSIVQSVSSKANVDEVTKRITKLHEDMSNGKLTYEEGKAEAVGIASDIINKSSAMVGKDVESYNEAKRIFKSTAQTDVAYKQLQKKFGVDMFPDTAGRKQMLDNINEYFDLVKPIAENPYDFGKAMVIESVANDIVDSGMEIQQAAPSAVDKERAKAAEAKEKAKRTADEQKLVDAMYYGRLLAEERAKHKEALAKERGRTAEAKAQAKADAKQQREIANAEKSVIREQRDAKLSEQQSYYQDMIERLRNNKDKKIESILQHQRDVNKLRSEMRAERNDRGRLLRLAKRLTKKNIDPGVKAMLPSIVEELDTVSVGITGKSVKELSDLRDWYNAKTDQSSPEYDPDFIPDKAILKKIERLEKVMNGGSIKSMKIEDVRDLITVLQNIEHQANESKKFQNSQLKIDNFQAGIRTTNDIENAQRGNVNRELSPIRAIRQIVGYADGSIPGTTESPLITLMKECIIGGDRAEMFKRRSRDRVKTWLNDKPFMDYLRGKKASEIELQGYDTKTGKTVKVLVTPAMRISLYLHSLNEDNMRHICGYTREDGSEVAGGGVTIPNMKLYKKGDIAGAYDAGVNIRLTKSELDGFVRNLPAKDKAFADALYQYFNVQAPSALNGASMLIDGYEKFNEENYFPINVNKNFINQDYQGIVMNDDGSLTHPGFGEERIQSTKAIYLRDATEVFKNALNANADYAFKAVPLMNMNKLLNVQNGSIGVMDALVHQGVKAKSGGDYANDSSAVSGKAFSGITISPADYIKNFMKDYAGAKSKRSGTLEKGLAKLRSNYSQAVLTLGLGTAIKQAASYPTAAAILSTKSLAAAATSQLDVSFIDARTAAFTQRAEGFSTLELAELEQEGKHIPKYLNWIQMVDVGTTKLLKRACAEEVLRTTNYLPGTEEYKHAVTDLYRRVIQETQPNYSVENRPDILRSDSALERALVMFATQPMQNYGILHDALGDLKAKQRAYQNNQNAKPAYDAAVKKFAKAVSSQVVSSLVFALMQAGWDWFRMKDDKYLDDDGEWSVPSFLKGLGLNMLQSGFGMFVGGKVALETIEVIGDLIIKKATGKKFFNQNSYGFSVAEFEAITDVVDSLTSLIRMSTSDKKQTPEEIYKKVKAAVSSIGSIVGLPVNNALSLVEALKKQVYDRLR